MLTLRTLFALRALLALNATDLDENLIQETMSVILKYEADIRKAENEIGKLVTKKEDGSPEADQPAGGGSAPAKKGALH